MREVVKDRCLQWWNSSFVKEWKFFTSCLLSTEMLSFHIYDLMSNCLENDWFLDGVFGIPINVFLNGQFTISLVGLKYNFELWNHVVPAIKNCCYCCCYLNKRGNTFHLMLWLHLWKLQTKVETDTADDRLEGKSRAISR